MNFARIAVNFYIREINHLTGTCAITLRPLLPHTPCTFLVGIFEVARFDLSVIDNGEYRFLPIKDTPMLEIGKFVGEFKDTQCVAVLEDVHSVFGSSAQGTINFGLSKGVRKSVLRSYASASSSAIHISSTWSGFIM